ncbi:EF-P 5-aminopentanol modification-associated protein YfmF [Bacillus thermotolerans]|uniref:Zinc protease n=1 Tax=Bacillus thermotolerans TaxID=1221996 RepID=A0A0F5IAD6_BACTR|nr:pitrilysin family protein [Bacillus thermotolerans]KKB38915.1 Zinc protease [Bacillus thermotolerans]KKB42418.1 Zinc protease [Bacillus thermotolerans]
MALVNETIIDKNGYKLHIVPTDKYKTITLMWKMKAPLKEETITKRALLPYVLQGGSEKYPTSTDLRSYLDDLYGASFYVDLGKKGNYHVINFTMEVANEKFLKESESLLERAFSFMHEVLQKPLVENGSFNQDIVDDEKRSLKQRIESVYDDKMRYANARLLEEMYKDDPYSLHVNGRLDDIDQLNASNLYQYYEQAFAEDELDLYVVGDVQADQVETMADSFLQFTARTPQLADASSSSSQPAEVKEVKEKQDIKQGKLHIGCRTYVAYKDEDYFAMQLFNGIFGGFSHSKLFTNVREKASLAYYAASRLESHKGFLMILSGIDSKNYEQAVAIIREQLSDMKDGKISDNELEQTKAVLRNQLLETVDTARGIIEMLYQNVVGGREITIDQWLEAVERTTKEEVVSAAGKVEMDTIYFLSGTEGE